MSDNTDFIRFDWAIKRILRDKANTGVLEGLLTVLLQQKITITDILESESNRDAADDKSNCVDVKARTSTGEIIIVEVQLAREEHFMQRILFGTSRAVTEQLKKGVNYDEIAKVYSVNVLYFDLGSGEDYVYHGVTTFTGINKPDSVLQFNSRESELVGKSASVTSPNEVFPEYYLLRVNQFNAVAKTPIEEWFDYFKRGYIREDTQAPGLQEAREKLDYMRLSNVERHEYESFMMRVHQQNDIWETAKKDGYYEGLSEGRAEGLSEGRAEERMSIARRLKANNVPMELILTSLNMTAEEYNAL